MWSLDGIPWWGLLLGFGGAPCFAWALSQRERPERGRPMPLRYEKLAVYNAECSRGIVHTPDWDAKMALLQEDFDAWVRGGRDGHMAIYDDTRGF